MATGHSGFDQKLLEAARRCDGRTLEGLVKDGKANLNAADKTGCTAVHLCCKAADLASLALLLKHGARTDIFDNKGMAPLHHAAMKDYIETMEVLVSSGASVNIQNEISKETPLHIAARNKNARSIKFLLFCGADALKKDKFGKAANLCLSKEKLDKYSDVSTAFKEGHIEVFGKIIDTFERATFKSAGLTIANTSTKSKQFTFFCRKIKVDHVTLSVAENEGIKTNLKECNRELISDVYEYLVNQDIDEVWVSVPVFTQATDFETVYFLDSTGNKFKFTGIERIDQVVYYTACIVLKAYEDTVYSFAVVMETKSDIYVFDGKAQTCSSTVEIGFKLHLPENCLPRNTEVTLKVIPTIHYQQVLNTDLMKSTSHFCEIIINQNTRKALNISLPVPKGHEEFTEKDGDIRMAVFHSHDASESQSDWNEIDSSWKPGSENVTVTDKSIKNGTCIVAVIPKKKGNGIFNKIKQFIMWLYDTAARRKEHICFFAMTKQNSTDKFRLLVAVCDRKALDENIKKLESHKFIGEYSQHTQNYLASSRTKFVAQLNSTREEICLTYHRQTTSRQDFIVSGKERDFTKVLIYKVETESNVGEDGRKLKSLTQINVELKGNQHEREQNTHSLQFTEYPDDRFLSWLAQEIGHEWMMIGICLGFNLSFLERIERDNTPTRANLTMLYAWRTEQSKTEDLGLKVLLHSLASVQRNDLVTKINKEVQALLVTKPDERVSRWIQKLFGKDKEPLKEVGGLDDIDGPLEKQLTECGEQHGENLCINCLTKPEHEASPMSDKFLAHLATMVGSNIQLILQLGLLRSEIDEIRHSIPDPTAAMFKFLLLAKRRYKHQADFFQDLMDGLKIQQNIESIRKVQEMCIDWFKTNKSSMDDQMKKLEQIIKRY